MLAVCDKYALIKLCYEENICDATRMIQSHKEAALVDKVVRFIDEKSKEVLKSDIWKNNSNEAFNL